MTKSDLLIKQFNINFVIFIPQIYSSPHPHFSSKTMQSVSCELLHSEALDFPRAPSKFERLPADA